MNPKIKFITGIVMTLLVIMAVKKGGLTLCFGILIGMSFMAWALLSGSPMTMFIVKHFGQQWYFDELRKAADARKRPESIKEAESRIHP